MLPVALADIVAASHAENRVAGFLADALRRLLSNNGDQFAFVMQIGRVAGGDDGAAGIL